MRILIVEPTRTMQNLLRMVFPEDAYIDIVTTSEDALSKVKMVDYQFVLVSMYLPDSNGIDLCKSLRRHKNLMLAPIILLTSEDDKGILDRAIMSGITEIYQKTDITALTEGLNCYLTRTDFINLDYAKVLYIEDENATAAATIAFMEELNLDIDRFAYAEEAWESFLENDYDFVLTDILLAGKQSGLDLVRQIRLMDGSKKAIPILAISGLDDVSRRIKVLNLGANDYITKPVIKEEFQARMRNLITNKRLFDQVKEQGKRLESLAMTDQLTQLYNRHALNELAPKAIKSAIRHNHSLSLLVIDLDHFKIINDQHGHAVGDSVLTKVGELLKEWSRQEDIVARFGGEEFVILLSHCAVDDAQKKAEHLRQAIIDLKPDGLDITTSIGVSGFQGKQKIDFDTLFQIADKAVYDAKAAGRNCVCIGEHSIDAVAI